MTIEYLLFEWGSFINDGLLSAQFMDCTLKKTIGNFPVGTHFDNITIDGEYSTLTLINKTGNGVKDYEEFVFPIELSIGEQLNSSSKV